ncbi:MAG TPA: NADH-quinone oxidoreductase subunit N [Dissulfurispiraceae bacterium]|nr:NADH-quinone oxidoreductase subunit N [Dissulfurispiraceae bacterium]
MSELRLLTPEIVLTICMLGIFLSGLAIRSKGLLGLLTIAAAAVTTYLIPLSAGTAFDGMFVADEYSVYFKLLFMVTLMLGALLAVGAGVIREGYAAEYFCLLMLASIGMMCMASANDLIVLYIGLELMSLSVYVLTGFQRENRWSNEAAMKYLLLGTFATAILLFGIAMVYILTGSTSLPAVALSMMTGGNAAEPLLGLSILAIVIAFGFKIAAVPFHMWAPDAYQGAPTPVTAFMSVGPKAAAFAAFGRVLIEGFGAALTAWAPALTVLVVLTVAGGNLLALRQDNVKRMLAYSSVAHAGYMLLGVLAGTLVGMKAVMTYMGAYVFMNMGAFAVMLSLENGEERPAYVGLAKRRPILAISMMIFLFSLTGIPPAAGFVGKLQVFLAAVDAGHTGLVILAVIFSVVSAYYYLRLVGSMFMRQTDGVVAISSSRTLLFAVLLTAFFVMLLGIFPSLVIAI